MPSGAAAVASDFHQAQDDENRATPENLSCSRELFNAARTLLNAKRASVWVNPSDSEKIRKLTEELKASSCQLVSKSEHRSEYRIISSSQIGSGIKKSEPSELLINQKAKAPAETTESRVEKPCLDINESPSHQSTKIASS